MTPSTRDLSSSPYAGNSASSSDLTDDFGTTELPEASVVARAQRLVAGHVQDPEVVAELLDIIGIQERV